VSSNWAWAILGALIILLLVRRWFAPRTEDPAEQVRYLIRSSGASTAETLGAKGGLVVSRYYFRQTDLEAGPADRDVFYDELFIELKEPQSGQTWQNSIHVATPRGLDRMMAEEHWDSVIGTELLIVRRYEVDSILHGAIDHLQELYETQVQILGRSAAPPEAGYGSKS
jgi:hypothetical protein